MGSIFRFKNRQTWWIQYYINGRCFRESSHSTDERDAQTLLARRTTEAANGTISTPKMQRLKFEELAEDSLRFYRVNNRKSLEDQERRFKNHINPYFGYRRAQAIGATEILKYIELRQNQEATNATINRELSAIKLAYSLGIKAGKVLRCPSISMLAEDNIRQGFYEEEQFELLCSHLPDEIVPVARFGYITGWRKAEILSLQWWQVDFVTGAIRLEPGTTKSGKGRVFPFRGHVALTELLKSQELVTRRTALILSRVIPWVFHRDGEPILDFRKAWEAAHIAAALPRRLFHDLRRTAIRNFVRSGMTEGQAMALSGHKTAAVFRRYDIISEEDLRKAVGRLNEYAAGGKK